MQASKSAMPMLSGIQRYGHEESGFSLVELIVVIGILALLAVNIIPRFQNIRDNANRAMLEGAKGSFASGLTILRSELAIEGKFGQTSVPVGGQILDVNSAGFPGNFPVNGCVTLWEDIHNSSDPINPWLTTPAGMTAKTWEALTIAGAPGLCVFINRRIQPISEFILYLPDPAAFGFTENVLVLP